MKTLFRITLIAMLTLAVVGGTILTLLAKREEGRQQAAKALQTVAPAVELMNIEAHAVEYSLDAVGKTEPSSEVTIIAENPGRISALYLREGGAVAQGQVLAETDTELRRISLEAAESSLRQAERTLRRLENLYAENNATEAELENARYSAEQAHSNVASAKRLIRDARITAPISGVVTQKHVEPGAVVQPGQPLAKITNIATLKVVAPLSEQDITKIKKGQPVKVTFDALPGKTASGRVTNIAVVADEAGRFDVEISVANSSGEIRAGMSARTQFGGATRKNVVTIPKTALLSLAATPSVFILNPDGTAVLRTIELGNSTGDNGVEVLSGLHTGDRLVIKGQDNLKTGDKPGF